MKKEIINMNESIIDMNGSAIDTKESAIEWITSIINCSDSIFPIFIGLIIIFVIFAIYLYKKKCDKNPIELFLEAIRTGNKVQIAGILAFLFLLKSTDSTNEWLQGIGYIGIIIIILTFILTPDSIERIENKLDDGEEDANDSERKSVLGA